MLHKMHNLVKGKNGKYDIANTMKKVKSYANTHVHEVKILQIHNARPELKKKYHGY